MVGACSRTRKALVESTLENLRMVKGQVKERRHSWMAPSTKDNLCSEKDLDLEYSSTVTTPRSTVANGMTTSDMERAFC